MEKKRTTGKIQMGRQMGRRLRNLFDELYDKARKYLNGIKRDFKLAKGLPEIDESEEENF